MSSIRDHVMSKQNVNNSENKLLIKVNKFDNNRTICYQSVRYFADLVIIPEGYSVKIVNEFGSSIIEKIFVLKRFTFLAYTVCYSVLKI